MTRPVYSEYTDEADEINTIVKELKALGGKHNLMQISATRNVTYGKLWRAFRGNATKSTRRPVGQRLDEAQALALKQFLDHIDSIGFGIRREMHGIIPDDYWNFDECGVRLGVARSQLVWTGVGREIYVPHSNSRELVTLVETVRSNGEHIALMMIIAGQHLMEDWFENLPAAYLVGRSMAYSSTLFESELLKTQAAQAAYNSRRSGARKKLLSGGPVYAKEARHMKRQRQTNDKDKEMQALILKREEQHQKAYTRYIDEVLPAFTKFYWGNYVEVYSFQGELPPKSPANQMVNWRPLIKPVYRKAYIRWVMGPCTKMGRKRVAKMIDYAKATKPRPPTPNEDGDEGNTQVDPALDRMEWGP
ncbi:uncharacterized protein BDZ99DRAFT_474514 [Mytilinidion resinicola]|uniref:HTH CENPB-type domain-containing protein n=1 Tax=Mytilinidion resinicola TaxID=574789 RepID=A0A6A6YTP6_9PEZI|nr:uncharacterized protein BDZ99DRAFT_474514 [Mytilinidion resinicola]KAF2812326.1 hypothetical protein BDZ99DRAFT_474514 [Mytilinidion resinicola]